VGKINVVRPDGTTVAVDEEVYRQSTGAAGHAESIDEATSRRIKDGKGTGGLLSSILAAGVGAADTALGGIPSTIAAASEHPYFTEDATLKEPDWTKDKSSYLEFQRDHELATTIGGFVPSAVTGAGLGGAVSKGILGAAGGGVATKAVDTVAKLAGRTAEGALIGNLAAVQRANITGDQMTVEGAITTAGLDGLLNVAIAGLADRVLGAGSKAKAAITNKTAAEAEIAAAKETAERGASFKEPPTSWDEVKRAHSTAIKSAETVNRQIARDQAKYDEFLRGGLTKALNRDVSGVLNRIRTRPGYGKPAALATDAATPHAMFDVSDEVAGLGATGERAVVETGTQQFLREVEQQKSRALKLASGGYELNGGRWVKNADIAADKGAAYDELVSIKRKLDARFPAAASEMKPPPSRPGTPVVVDDVGLPSNFLRLGSANDVDLARVAKVAQDNPAVAESWGRLMADVGLKPTGNVMEDLAGLRGSMRDYRGAVSALEKAAAEEASKEAGTLLPILKKTLGSHGKRLALGAAGFGAASAAGAGWQLAGALGGALMAGKSGVQSNLSTILGKYGPSAGQTIKKMAPVTSYLSGRFISGERDDEKDVRQQAVNRIDEVIRAAQAGPDAMFSAVQGILGDPSDIGYKIHAFTNRALQYLVAAAPKDPGLDIDLRGSNWKPSYAQTAAFAHVMEAVMSPFNAIERALQGDGHPAATQALWDTYPAMMSHMAMEISFMQDKFDRVTYEGAGALSGLFRKPITGLQQPVVAASLQGLYLPKPPAAPQGSGGGGGGNPTGRPAAVQSAVAGSSVSGLISQ
jgi:hypothetical protein